MHNNDLDQYLKAVINNAIDGILLVDDKGIIIDINKAGMALFGYQQKEIKNKHVRMLLPQDHLSSQESYMAKYLNLGDNKINILDRGHEVEGLKKDGTLFPFKLLVTEIILSNKRYFTGVIHDLTDQKKAEKRLLQYMSQLEQKVRERTLELEESKELYEKIAINFPNGSISVLDKNGCFLFVEGERLKKSGKEASSIIKSEFMDTIEAKNKKEIRTRLKKVLLGKNQEFELEISNNIYDVKAVPLTDKNNDTTRILVVETNITQQKKAEKEIYNAFLKEKELGELKSNFVSMASHEFRTPLSTIMSSATLIEKYKNHEEQDKRIKHVDRIKNNVSNLNMILNDFLSLEKLETGRFQIRREKFNVMDLIESLCQDFEIIKRTGQSIQVESLLKKDELLINTDRFLLQNALTNLLSNAVKYSNPDTKITIRLDKIKPDFFAISIQDEGRGISKQDQKSLFTRFFRAENAGTVQGTGLGLHIVKRYVDLLGGTITLFSDLNKGSIFTIQLKA